MNRNISCLAVDALMQHPGQTATCRQARQLAEPLSETAIRQKRLIVAFLANAELAPI